MRISALPSTHPLTSLHQYDLHPAAVESSFPLYHSFTPNPSHSTTILSPSMSIHCRRGTWPFVDRLLHCERKRRGRAPNSHADRFPSYPSLFLPLTDRISIDKIHQSAISRGVKRCGPRRGPLRRRLDHGLTSRDIRFDWCILSIQINLTPLRFPHPFETLKSFPHAGTKSLYHDFAIPTKRTGFKCI